MLTICSRIVGIVYPEKIGPKTFAFVRFFDDFETWRISADRNVIATIKQGHSKVPKVFYVVSKFHELCSTNGLKADRFTNPDYFVLSQSIALSVRH